MTNTAKLTTFSIILIASVLLIPFCAFAWPVPDSGQTKCYNDTEEITCPAPGEDFYGQDAQYTINPPSYTKLDENGDDLPFSASSWVMVRDNVTGLIWEVKQAKDYVADYDNPHDADNTYTWYDSNPETNGGDAGTQGDGTDTEDFINALNAENFGGHSDWRLPTLKELASIANLGTYDPAIDTEYFPNTGSSYWSSSTNASNTDAAWAKDSGDFGIGKSTSRYVRAVRGGQSGSFDNLLSNGDGTVTDRKTGLMWQGTDTRMNWKESLAYCENLSLAGYEDWRLPNREELRSIVDYGKYDPALNTEYFPDISSWPCWSSSTNANHTDLGLCVSSSLGIIGDCRKTGPFPVLAVRSGGQFGPLTISAAPEAGGTVTGTGISCPDDCAQTYDSETAVQLTATPADCYEFTSWSGDCSGTSPTCTLTVNDEKSATANFAIKTFTVTISKTGNGTGTLSESTQTVNCGDSLTITATPDISSDFADWSGDASGAGNAELTNITSDKTLTATFDLKTFTVTINKAGNGTGDLSESTQTVNYGTSLTVTATPDETSDFAGWSDDASGTGNAELTNITSEKTITATFNLKTFTVTTNKAGNGTGNLSASTQSVNYGSNLTVTATPDANSTFAGWSGDATGTGSAVLTNITSEKTLTATFDLKTFTVTINKAGDGTGDLSESTQTVNYGTSLTVTATPDATSDFAGWSGGASGTGDAVLTNIISDKVITATFNLKAIFTVTINKAGSGTGILSEETQEVNGGSDLTIRATPDVGSKFVSWSEDASGSENPLKLTNITTDMTITAIFLESLPPANLDLAAEDDTGPSNTDNATLSTTGLTITGTGEDGATIKLFDKNEEITHATVTVSAGVFSADITLTEPGSHIITAQQTDPAGNTSRPSDPLIITIVEPDPDLSLTITTPPNSQIVPPPAEIRGEASLTAGQISRIELKIGTPDGSSHIAENGGQFHFTETETWIPAQGTDSWSLDTRNVEWPPGTTYIITAQATDTDGKTYPSVSSRFTTEKETSAITCELSSDIIILGDPIKITGRLTPSPDEAGEGVDIELTYEGTQETLVKTALTDTNGDFSYDLPCETLTRAGIWTVQSRWEGSETLEGSTSPEQTLIVNKAESGLTLNLSPDAIETGDPVSISGTFTPLTECDTDLSGIPVTLGISGPDNETDTESVHTKDRWGHFSLEQYTGFTAPGDWTVQALFEEDDAFLSCESDEIQVQVAEHESPRILLSPDDDTGTSDEDNLTKYTSEITITGSGRNGATVKLYDNGEEVPGATAVISEDNTFSIDISLTQMFHSVTVIQTDTAGNESPPSPPLNIIVDTEAFPPWQLSLSSGRDSGISETDNLTQHTSGLKIGGFGENGSAVQLYDNGEPILATTVSGYLFSAEIPLTEGKHRITAVQTDPAGNHSPPSVPLTITVDATPPAPPEFREAVTPTNNPRPSWHWKAGNGNGKFRYSLDNSDLDTSTSETRNTAYTPETDLSEGTHTLYVQECDDAGNWSESAFYEIEVSDSKPGAPRVSGTTPTRDPPVWTWTPGGNGNGKYRHKLDSDTLDINAEFTNETSYTPSFQLTPEGPHTLYVQEQDAAGNWSASGSFTIETDTGIPFSKASAPESANAVNTTFEITYTCYDVYADNEDLSGSGLTSVKLYVRGPNDRLPDEVDADIGNAIDGIFEYTPDDPGEYAFYTLASDRAGNMQGPPAGGYDAETVYSSELAGYAILSVGSVKGQEGIESHTLSANNIYSYLIQHGFALIGDPVKKWNDPLDNIKYYNPFEEPQTGEDDYIKDAGSYKLAIQKAITEWAAEKMNRLPGPLYIILLDHGSLDTFYLTGGQPVSAGEMDEWLDTLEEKTEGIGIENPETGESEPPPIVIILGACYSGSFIDDLSAEGRVIVASSAGNEPSYRGPINPYSGVRDGEFFTGSLFKELNQGYSLKIAFERAVIRTEAYTYSGTLDKPLPWRDTAKQHPLLDDNGDGEGSNLLTSSGDDDDGDVSENIFLGQGDDAPEPLRVTVAETIPFTPPALKASENQATLWARVSDTERTDRVWVEIRSPGMILEQEEDDRNQQTVELTSIPLEWKDSEERYEGVYKGFTEPGKYRLFFYAKDKTGIISPFKKVILYKALPPLRGDVNGNDVTDLADAVLILRILCGAEISIESVTLAGDMSKDGKIGVEDAVGVLRQLAGF